MSRKAFSIHSDYYKELLRFDEDDLGELVKVLILWAKDDVIPADTYKNAMLFRLMTDQIKRISEANKKNAEKVNKQNYTM